MPPEPTRSLALVLGCCALAIVGGCAVVFGLDEPSVREGEGGGTTSGAATQGAPATATTTTGSQGPGGGDGDGGRGVGGGEATSSTSTGAGPCDGPAQCDDDNPCTQNTCDDGACVFVPVGDGPLEDAPGDCVDRACLGGELIESPDDAEEPVDVNPPCELTQCIDGVPAPQYADAGTSCGPDPQECDGAGNCVGCDPSGPGSQCGQESVCAAPSCVPPGICDPGHLPSDTVLSDVVDGDCRRRECTGSSAAPIDVDDDTDVPTELPCNDRTCSGGAIADDILDEGTVCIGEAGVCDGMGGEAGNCKTCRDTTPSAVDAGCTATTPHCDETAGGGEGICRECLISGHCNGSEAGEDCLNDFTCGCNGGADCSDSPQGRYCELSTDECGCLTLGDCNEADRGDDCLGGTCGCDDVTDCQESDWGTMCLAGACGCEDDGDCQGAAEDCNPTTNRCE